ncbi:SGNH/GDSL hydrolase family protein [Flavobacteriaceae bacterium 3-367]
MKLWIGIRLLLAFMCFSATLHAQKVLFMGNSLTYTNDLPQLVAYLAKNFDKSLETTSLCFPNYALEDHWNDGLFQKMLAEQNFDYVIVQQGPSSQEAGKQMLLEYGKKIKNVCAQYGAQLAYYMVWPSKRYYFTFDKVIANHEQAAKELRALLFPVGVHWKTYGKNDFSAQLYGPDDFHPSPAGTFLAALTIFHGLFPKEKLSELKFEDVKKWVPDTRSFQGMTQLVHKKKDMNR